MERLIAGNFTAKEILTIKACLYQVIETDRIMHHHTEGFMQDVQGIYDVIVAAVEKPEIPYVGVTEDVEFVMEMLNDDYSDVIMSEDNEYQTDEEKSRFAKGLDELNNLVNCHKR